MGDDFKLSERSAWVRQGCSLHNHDISATTYNLSAIIYQLSLISYHLSAITYQLSPEVGYVLLLPEQGHMELRTSIPEVRYLLLLPEQRSDTT